MFFQDTTIPHPAYIHVCLRLQLMLCVCLYFRWLSSFWSWSQAVTFLTFYLWWLIKKTTNKTPSVNMFNTKLRNIVTWGKNVKRNSIYKIPPRNKIKKKHKKWKTFTTTNDNINNNNNNKHNIGNYSKNYQTTTTTTTTKKKVSQTFLFNPILYSSVR